MKTNTLKKPVVGVIITTFLWSNIVWAGGVECYSLSAPSQVTGLVPIAGALTTGESAVGSLVGNGITDKTAFYREISKGRIVQLAGVPVLMFSDKDDPTRLSYYVFSPNEPYFSRITTDQDVDDSFWQVLQRFGVSLSSEVREFSISGKKYYQQVFAITDSELKFITTCLKTIYPDWRIELQRGTGGSIDIGEKWTGVRRDEVLGYDTRKLSKVSESTEYRNWLVSYIERKFGKGLKIISIGAGRGHLEKELMKRGHNVTAVELKPEYVEECRRKGIRTICADGMDFVDLLEEDNLFDLVIFSESLGSIGLSSIRESSRVLKKNGHILIAEYPYRSDEDVRMIRRRFPVNRLKVDEIREALKEYGFRDIETEETVSFSDDDHSYKDAMVIISGSWQGNPVGKYPSDKESGHIDKGNPGLFYQELEKQKDAIIDMGAEIDRKIAGRKWIGDEPIIMGIPGTVLFLLSSVYLIVLSGIKLYDNISGNIYHGLIRNDWGSRFGEFALYSFIFILMYIAVGVFVAIIKAISKIVSIIRSRRPNLKELIQLIETRDVDNILSFFRGEPRYLMVKTFRLLSEIRDLEKQGKSNLRKKFRKLMKLISKDPALLVFAAGFLSESFDEDLIKIICAKRGKWIEDVVIDLLKFHPHDRVKEFAAIILSQWSYSGKMRREKARKALAEVLGKRRAEIFDKYGIWIIDFRVEEKYKFKENDIDRIESALRLIPQEHINAGVAHVVVRTEPYTYVEKVPEWIYETEGGQEMAEKIRRLGVYDERLRMIRINEVEGIEGTVCHEIGHGVHDFYLTKGHRRQFDRLYKRSSGRLPPIGKRFGRGVDYSDFAYPYGARNEDEDFATIYEMWLIDEEAFEKKAENSGLLRAKYEVVKSGHEMAERVEIGGLIANGSPNILVGKLEKQKDTLTDLREEIDKNEAVAQLKNILRQKMAKIGDKKTIRKIEQAIADLETFNIKEFSAIVLIVLDRDKPKSKRRWLLGFNSLAPPIARYLQELFPYRTLGYAREALDNLEDDALLEYLLHEPLCRYVGHREARGIQEILFEDSNYKDARGEPGTKNGVVGEVLGRLIEGVDDRVLDVSPEEVYPLVQAGFIGQVLRFAIEIVFPGVHRDRDRPVRNVSWYIRRLKSSDELVVRNAVIKLGELGDRRAVEPLLRLLEDIQGSRKINLCIITVNALKKLGDKRAEEPLKGLLLDRNDNIRAAAREALYELGITRGQILEIYIQALRSAPSPVYKEEVEARRERIAKALGELGDPGAVKTLINLLRDKRESVREAAAFALGELGDCSAEEPLLRLLEERSWSVNYTAPAVRGALYKIGTDALKIDLATLASPVREKRFDAWVRLLRLRATDEQFVFGYKRALRSESPDVRRKAVGELKRYGMDEADIYIGMLAAPEWLEAKEKLRKLKVPEEKLLAGYIEVLQSRYDDARQEAARALGELGSAGAIEPLSEHLEFLREQLAGTPVEIKRNIYDRHASVIGVEIDRSAGYEELKREISIVKTALRRLERVSHEKEGAVDGVRLDLIEDALRHKRIALDKVPSSLREFLRFLKQNGLTDIVVAGGGVRDIFFGLEPKDFDITVKARCTEEERKRFRLTTSEASRRVYGLMWKEIERLADVMDVDPEDFRMPDTDVPAPVFKGKEVQFSGPVEITTRDEQKFLIKRFIVDADTKEGFSSNSGPGLLQMAIDCDGNLYGCIESLEDLLRGEVRIYGDGENFTFTDSLRLLILKHQFGLEIPEEDYELMKQSIERQGENYRKVDISLGKVLEVIQRNYDKILETAKNRDAAQKELDELGVTAVLDELSARAALHDERKREPIRSMRGEDGLIARGDHKVLCKELEKQKDTITDLRPEIDRKNMAGKLRRLLEQKKDRFDRVTEGSITDAIADLEEKFDIKEFNAIVLDCDKPKSKRKWLLGFNSLAPPMVEYLQRLFPNPTLGYTREALDRLEGDGLLEYLLHEALCRYTGHYEARKIQEILFEESNYFFSVGESGRKDGKLSEVLEKVIYKGFNTEDLITFLGVAVLGLIVCLILSKIGILDEIIEKIVGSYIVHFIGYGMIGIYLISIVVGVIVSIVKMIDKIHDLRFVSYYILEAKKKKLKYDHTIEILEEAIRIRSTKLRPMLVQLLYDVLENEDEWVELYGEEGLAKIRMKILAYFSLRSGKNRLVTPVLLKFLTKLLKDSKDWSSLMDDKEWRVLMDILGKLNRRSLPYLQLFFNSMIQGDKYFLDGESKRVFNKKFRGLLGLICACPDILESFPNIRYDLIYDISKMRGKEIEDMVVKLVESHPDPEVKESAAIILSQWCTPKIFQGQRAIKARDALSSVLGWRRTEIFNKYGVWIIDINVEEKYKFKADDIDKIGKALCMIPAGHLKSGLGVCRVVVRTEPHTYVEEVPGWIYETEGGRRDAEKIKRFGTYYKPLRMVRINEIEGIGETICHEIGHGVYYYCINKLQRRRFNNLHKKSAEKLPPANERCRWGIDYSDFAYPYGATNEYEDFATIYELMLTKETDLDWRAGKSELLNEKYKIAKSARLFIINKIVLSAKRYIDYLIRYREDIIEDIVDIIFIQIGIIDRIDRIIYRIKSGLEWRRINKEVRSSSNALCKELEKQKDTISDLRPEIERKDVVRELRKILDQKRNKIDNEETINKIEQAISDLETFDIVEFGAIVLDRDKSRLRRKWLLGFNSLASPMSEFLQRLFPNPTLGYAREVLDNLEGAAILEYLLREALCRYTGCFEDIRIQEILFEDSNYVYAKGKSGRKEGIVNKVLSYIIDNSGKYLSVNDINWASGEQIRRTIVELIYEFKYFVLHYGWPMKIPENYIFVPVEGDKKVYLAEGGILIIDLEKIKDLSDLYESLLSVLEECFSRQLIKIWEDYPEESIVPSEGYLEDITDEEFITSGVVNGDERILDIGTGTGYTAIALAERFPDAKITGVDISDRLLGIARKRAEEKGLKIAFVNDDATRLAFEEGTFDVVFLASVLKGVPKPIKKRILKEAFRVLRPGGRLNIYDEVFPVFDVFSTPWTRWQPQNVLSWNMWEWEEVIEETGFVFNMDKYIFAQKPVDRSNETGDSKVQSGLGSGMIEPKQGPIAKKTVNNLYLELWEAEIKDLKLQRDSVLLGEEGHSKLGKIDRAMLEDVLMKLSNDKQYGPGILAVVDAIRVVDNVSVSQLPGLPVSPYVMMVKEGDKNILLLDIDAFENEELLYLVLEHELKESIMAIIPYENEAVRELTANYMSLKSALERGISTRFLASLGMTGDSFGMTGGLVGADLRFFEALEVLQAMEEATDEDIIAVAIEHMRGMPYYTELFRQFSFAGEWEERIKDAEDRYRAALRVFNDIAEAKQAAQKVKETKVKVDGVVKGLSDSIRKIRMVVNSRVRWELDFVDALVKNNKYIMLDRSELAKPENAYIRDWIERMVKGRERSPFIYSDEGMPEGVSPEDVIDLREPGKVNDRLPQDRLYLPLPYSISSIYLASQVVLAGGKVEQIKDKLALNAIKALYETLLGRKITGEELYELFRTPWTVLPPIVQITGTLNALRKAIAEIEKAA